MTVRPQKGTHARLCPRRAARLRSPRTHSYQSNSRETHPVPDAVMRVHATLLLAALSLDRASLGSGTADFVFPDFNSTHGLSFAGSSGTTTCVNASALRYGAVQGRADEFDGELPPIMRETEEAVTTATVGTSVAGDQERIGAREAGFGHRENVTQSPDAAGARCRVRARLTPSLPSKAGALWYSVPVPVTRGFETLFTIQVTDHSRVCTEHSDPFFSRKTHTTCSVWGGDGLAFVLQRDDRGEETVGRTGGELGYGGISNSLAVELDSWYNAGENSTDLLYDHVAVHAAGPSNNNSALGWAELAPPRRWSLADGDHHLIKVKYIPRVALEYLDKFTASSAVLDFVKDNGVSRRLGTLVVWVDEGVEQDSPLLAIPINLSVVLDLPQDLAYVGFTASTGSAWAKHDVLAWYWCHNDHDQPAHEGGGGDGDGDGWDGCGETAGFSHFDFGQTSRHFASRYRQHAPGDGYGAGDTSGYPTRHTSPDTDPWDAPKQHWSEGRTSGVFSQNQVPPFTENRRS